MSSGSWFHYLLGKLLGLDNLQSIDSYHFSFGESWAQRAPAWVLFGCLALAFISAWFYLKYQTRVRTNVKYVLAAARAIVLALLFIMLANPILQLVYVSSPRPLLYFLVDGTDSMAIEDEVSADQRAALVKAVGWEPGDASTAERSSSEEEKQQASEGDQAENKEDAKPTKEDDNVRQLSRMDYVRTLLGNEDLSPLKELSKKFRVKVFMLDKPDGVRAISTSETGDGELDLEYLKEQLTTTGEVTAIGEALDDLAQRHSTSHLAGLVLFSDFAQNAGPAPVGAGVASPVSSLGIPIYAVGVGPEDASDLIVSLSARPIMKKAERDTLMVTLRQNGLAGRNVEVILTAKQLGGDESGLLDSTPREIGRKTVELKEGSAPVEFPFTPQETGRFVFAAEVEPLSEEKVTQNNRAEREVNIRDDFLRLMFVAYEPTWEWRFIKEVFHRDKLVGIRGFRTYLRSSDPKVRRANPLFLPTLTPPRSEFFANDVIFLEDMPENVLSTRFCEMVKEFVSTFGGGLVVMAGPRFGPGQLAGTPLADMLPVVVDSGAQIRDQEFQMQLAPQALSVDFMQLGDSESESANAWKNMGPLNWYQPVLRPAPLAEVLAQHPKDKCVDGVTPQPLIAIRRYGKGEVVYVGFDETWRLRRRFGERYYRQFWGQMIYHLGLRHTLGSQKRFVVSTDRQQYRADDEVLLTVEAFDENFQQITEDKLPDRRLEGKLIVPELNGNLTDSQDLSIPISRPGVFETRFPVLEGGEHRVRVRDPITNQYTEVLFNVASLSVERQSAVRNAPLQRDIAQISGGKAYELTTLASLVDDIKVEPQTEISTKVFPLWSTWLCFALVISLLMGEWLLRKWVNLV